MLKPVSHIDNITYSFIRSYGKRGRKKPIILNWSIVNRFFHKYGETVTSRGKISKYKYYDTQTKVSYKIFGNAITISLGKAVFSSYIDKETYYTKLVKAVMYLYDNDFLQTNRLNTRQAAYYLLRSRGTVSIEHAIDVYGLESSKQSRGIDSLGKRYQREGFTRFEVIVKGVIDKYRPQLKSIQLLDSFIIEVVKKHTKNFYAKCSSTLISILMGITIGYNKQFNYKKIRAWVYNIIITTDYSLVTDIKILKGLRYKEQQNKI